MASIADAFAARLADLETRDRESQKRLAEHIASIRTQIDELERLERYIDQLAGQG